MKKSLLISLVTLVSWTSFASGQAALGTPITSMPSCESCNPAPGPLPPPTSCKTQFCQSGLGQMAKSLLTPIRHATGNLLPVCCVDSITKEDLARMLADGGYAPAEIAAAKIKLDEAQANARRAAVRYLATVNCHYYPEAESGLIAALRADRSECVRLEAALALATCRCATSRIVDALSVAVMGCEIDGNPGETSPRVRAAAEVALHRCLAQRSCEPAGPPQMLPPADWSVPAPLPSSLQVPALIQPMNYFAPQSLEPLPASLLYERSRAESVGAQPKNTNLTTGQRSLYHLLLHATSQESAKATSPASSLPRQTYND